MSQLLITTKIHFRKGRRTRKELQIGELPQPVTVPAPPLRLPRITKLMALAIRFEQLVQRGAVRDYADLARLGHVSRTRITQIMALLQLAPEIQEGLLFLPRVASGKDPIKERHLRPIAAIANWDGQRRMWRQRKADSPVVATDGIPSEPS